MTATCPCGKEKAYARGLGRRCWWAARTAGTLDRHPPIARPRNPGQPRTCIGCGETKPFTAFRSGIGKDGYPYTLRKCEPCRREPEFAARRAARAETRRIDEICGLRKPKERAA